MNHPALEVRGLTKHFPGFDLEDVSFTLPQGYILGLIGPNGAGKSTSIKIILGAVTADSGSVRVYGEDPRNSDSDGLERIGFVHETPPLYDHLTAVDFGRINGLFYRSWNRDAFHQTLKRFELPPSKRTGTFSRGMKMKLSLAIAMSHDADLLLLDEPTSGLDPVFRREFLDELRTHIADGKRSVLFSTHITGDLESIADYIVYMKEGRVGLAASALEIEESWRIIRGGRESLTPEIEALLESVRIDSYSFTGITTKFTELEALANDGVVSDSVAFDDLVVLLEGRTNE